MSLPRAVLQPLAAHEPILSRVRIRTSCEDFEVEEIPEYQPCGDGEHLFLWIEKRNLSSGELLNVLSRQLNVSSRDIGVAGQKDRRAVTRQFVSVPSSAEPQIEQLADDRIQVLSAVRHGNKLRTGHLKGNRFRIALPLEETSDNVLAAAISRMERLETFGLPNYFGPQRFGFEGRTAEDGMAFLRGDIKASHWPPRKRRHMKRLVASAAQSAVFNVCLANRVSASTFNVAGPGDVVCRVGGIRPFLFDDLDPNADFEVMPMGPMPGPKMVASAGRVFDEEQQALHDLELSAEDFCQESKLTPGTRRPYVVRPVDCSAELAGQTLVLHFALPPGSFATILLAEIAKDIVSG